MHPGRFLARAVFLAAVLFLRQPAAAQNANGQAPEPPYPTMAAEPDPRDFFSRADTHITLLGNPIRLAGLNLDWLGLWSNDGTGSAARLPTEYEVNDALLNVQALGGTIARSRTLGASVGCPLCLMPSPGRMNDAAFAQVDMVLSDARNLGLKLIVPLAGGPQDCSKPDPYDGSLCFFVRARGRHDAADFFSDPAIRDDFLRYVKAVVTHVNVTTGEALSQNPAIMAWENCDGCGRGIDAATLADWSEAVGRAIHAVDKYHLYENGAFAGRIDPQAPGAAPASAWATASVDIVGDRVPPAQATRAADAVAKADRVYIVDWLAWSPRVWKTLDDFEAELDRLARQRLLAGALMAGLQGHADRGGYLPAPGVPEAFYFPGLDTALDSAQDMQERGRAFRRFAYRMAELVTPSFLLPPKPEIISAVHGRVAWRGSAGAVSYLIERATDLVAAGAWTVVCDACTDTAEPWQDPHAPSGPVWYRISPVNVNGHASPPSPPFRDAQGGK